jgi:carboxyl-terminal processing protease
MSKILFSILLFFITHGMVAQKVHYSAVEIDRFASLGKLWGMLHYFHPNVLNGKVVTDSLIVPAAKLLAADPSANGYRLAIEGMLARTNDPATRLERPGTGKVFLFTEPEKVSVYDLGNNLRYIAMPTDIDGEEELAKTGLMDGSWLKADGIVLDLRKADYSANTWSDQQFFTDMLPFLMQALAGKKRIPPLHERTAAHNGFVSQTLTSPNVYSSGWRTGILFQPPQGNGKPYNKPFVIVLHAKSHNELVSHCLLMASAGLCRVVVDSNEKVTANGSIYTIPLSDSLNAQIRVSDLYTGNGKLLPLPDITVAVTDTSLKGAFMLRCKELLKNWNEPVVSEAQIIGMEYVYPRPGRYSEKFYPEVGLRLMGLFNWWNAIHYFFPYKHLTDVPWDSVLNIHIPMMLECSDSLEYMFAVRSMVSYINDSHGFLNNANPATPARSILGYSPPIELAFIEGKLMVVGVGTDTAQDMGILKQWDEVIEINGEPVVKAIEKWRAFIASSNESTYFRDVVKYLSSGAKNSKITYTLVRKGMVKTAELKRTSRQMGLSKTLDFNDDYPALKMMQDSVLYINMGSLTRQQADSLSTQLYRQKILLFDLRNYPQGTAWVIAPFLTSIAKKAVLFDKPFVTPTLIGGNESKENLASGFTVMPANEKKFFTGRVFVLCNEQTQSQAEYTIMMFQGAIPCIVVGSQTAGADGNVTQVAIPGGYEAWFSGLGVLYPDGGQTQRTGIRVDVQVKPTIAGLKEGKDEVLEKALEKIAGN